MQYYIYVFVLLRLKLMTQIVYRKSLKQKIDEKKIHCIPNKKRNKIYLMSVMKSNGFRYLQNDLFSSHNFQFTNIGVRKKFK